jgi:hypothetical protein
MTPRSATLCLAIGIVAALLLVADAVWQTRAAAQAWLAAWLFWIGLAVGALFLLLVHGLTGGRWGNALRPVLLDMVGALPLLALFLLPMLLGVRQTYPWAQAGGHGWLGLTFFALRAFAYVVLWNALALMARRESGPDGALPPGFAWPALIILFLTASLAALDWIMTLEPHWVSTIFGMLVSAGWTLAALAAAILLAQARGGITNEMARDDLARLLIGFMALWAYLSAIQLIVIWESNLGSDSTWLLRRSIGGWGATGLLFPLFEFAVPFVLMLWQPLRRSPMVLAIAAALVLTAHLVETWWLAAPDFGRGITWADPLAVIAIGGCVLFTVGRGIGIPSLPALPKSSHERS